MSKTSPILLDAYNTLNSLILPPPSTFPYPLIESFAVAHDPLTEEHGQRIFTVSMALREAGLQVERAIRGLSKIDGDRIKIESEGSSSPMLSLSEVKRSRLRTKLQSVNLSLPISVLVHDRNIVIYSNLNRKLPRCFLHLKKRFFVPPRNVG